jgi:hypothetical protein
MDYTDLVKEKLGHDTVINQDNSMFYITTYEKLASKFRIENWNGNRAPDSARIPLITKTLYRNNHVDGMMYLAIFNDTTLVCYDGMHRLTALKKMYSRTSRPLYHTVILNILPIYDEVFINIKIRELNECKPIHTIDGDEGHRLRKKCEHIAERFKQTYKNMFSGSSRPRLPNTTRDIFVEKISKVIIELKLENTDDELIIKLIQNYNDYAIDNKSQFTRKLNQSAKTKCDRNECYIFAINNWDSAIIDTYNNGNIDMS